MTSLRQPLLLGCALAASLAAPARATDTEKNVEDLSSLSIEELARIEVRSASKLAEPLSRAATSLFVITDEDIARSAATSLPEVLRLAPNLQVQRLDARQYAVSARGFNGAESSNKLLVLIDGRSVYSTLQSGVFWELHSPLLEDIEQIEVVSGPGGTLFGPNAVNGVVNVASKDARQTLGVLVRGSGGANEQDAAIRFGTAAGAGGAVRFYANAFNRDDFAPGAAVGGNDRFRGWQAGFRGDWGSSDHVTLQGDVFATDTGGLPGDGDQGQNLLARWTHPTGEESSLQLQAYYDDYRRRFTLVDDSLETFDAQGQYNLTAGSHHVVLGAGVRTTRDRFINKLNGFHLDPESRRLWVVNGFAQDRITLSPNLDVIAGLKLERSSFSGLEVLPNLRLAWHPGERTLLWGAVSRAVRTPSRIDRQLVFLPLLAQATGFRSEKLVAFEAGYRGQPSSSTTLSVSLFYNVYDDIRTTEFAPGGALPIRLMNNLRGSSWGVEAWATQQLAPWWRGSLGVSTLHKDFRLKNGASDLANRASLGSDPDYQLVARSQMDLGPRVQLDVDARAVGPLENPALKGYVEADARLSWRVVDPLELFVLGNNLLHRAHAESADVKRAQLVPRSIMFGSRVRF